MKELKLKERWQFDPEIIIKKFLQEYPEYQRNSWWLMSNNGQNSTVHVSIVKGGWDTLIFVTEEIIENGETRKSFGLKTFDFETLSKLLPKLATNPEIFKLIKLMQENGWDIPLEDRNITVQKQINVGNYDEALKIILAYQKGGDYDFIWGYCQRFDEYFSKKVALPDKLQIGTFNEATLLKWYEAISEQNPHYKEANARLYYFKSTDKNDSFEDKAELLGFACKSGKQGLIDEACNRICGTNNLKNIKADHETIIQFAEVIREQQLALRNESVGPSSRGPAFFGSYQEG